MIPVLLKGDIILLCSSATAAKKNKLQAKSVYAVVVLGDSRKLNIPRFAAWPIRNFFWFFHKLPKPIESSVALASKGLFSGGVEKLHCTDLKDHQKILMKDVFASLEVNFS